MLALNVRFIHVHDALHVHQGTDGSCRYAMLTGAGLGNYAPLAHPAGYEDLSDGVGDFVGAGVVEVLSLQEDLRLKTLREPPCPVERTGTADVVAQERVVVLLETFTFQDGNVGLLQFLDAGVEYFRNICSAE